MYIYSKKFTNPNVEWTFACNKNCYLMIFEIPFIFIRKQTDFRRVKRIRNRSNQRKYYYY